MRAFRSLEETPRDFGPCALTIGNFDGVHIGHRRILDRVSQTAAEQGLRASVLTFDPHPASVVAPERAPRLMTTPEERISLVAASGIEQALILPFTPETAALAPEEFVTRILCERLGVRAVLVGDNFRFGHRQAGDVAALRDLGERYGFAVEIVPAVACRGRMVSSSAIRTLVETGDVRLAGRFLGRPYSLSGVVVRGRGVGSKQTVPTLNLSTACQVLPAGGVYVTRTLDLDAPREWRSVTNIGVRPTFDDGGGLSIETFLLEPLREPAPSRIAVRFLHRVREERRFASPEALRAQILHDAGRANTWFRRARAWVAR